MLLREICDLGDRAEARRVQPTGRREIKLLREHGQRTIVPHRIRAFRAAPCSLARLRRCIVSPEPGGTQARIHRAGPSEH